MSISQKYLYSIPIGFQLHINLVTDLVAKWVANERHHILNLFEILIILRIAQISLSNEGALFGLSISSIYLLFVAKQ